MKMNWFHVCLLLAAVCSSYGIETEPCKRVAEIAGNVIKFISTNEALTNLTKGMNKGAVSIANQQISFVLKDQYDLGSKESREDLVCTVFGLKTLKEAWNMGKSLEQVIGVDYATVCEYYPMVAMYAPGKIDDASGTIDYIGFISDWLQQSGFPDSFPIKGTYEDNLKVISQLKEDANIIHPNAEERDQLLALFSILMPLKAQHVWEPERGDYTLEASAEEITTLLTESTSLDEYLTAVSVLGFRTPPPASLPTFLSSFELLKDVMVLLGEAHEAINLVVKESNLLNLETNNCQ